MNKFLLTAIALITSLIGFSQINVNYQPSPIFVCNGNGLNSVVLETKNAEILNGLPAAEYTITYHLSITEAEVDVNPLMSPYFVTTLPSVVYVRVEQNSNPQNIAIVMVQIQSDPTTSFWPFETEICESDNDGISQADLNALTAQLVQFNGLDLSIITVTFHNSNEDANSGVNPLLSPYTNIQPFNEEIYARVENNMTGCYTVNPVYLIINHCSIFGQPENLVACSDSGNACFDLSSNTSVVLGNLDASDYMVSYHMSLSDAENNVSAIANLNAYCIAIEMMSPAIFIRVEEINSGNFEILTFYITGQQFTAGMDTLQPLAQCDEDQNNNVTFDLTSATALLNITNPVQYYANSGDAASQINPITTPAAYSVNLLNQMIPIFIRETINGDCDIVHSIQIIGYSNCNTASACGSANPLCNVLGISFQNTVNVSDAGPGQFSCLGSTPNPTWFYIPVSVSGIINLQVSQVASFGGGIDVDFVCYGPFTDPTIGCNSLFDSNVVACSYSTAAVENFTINGIAGQYYLLMVTNFANQPGDITIAVTGGNGQIDCTGLQLTAFLDNNGNGVKDGSEQNFQLGEFHYEMNDDGIEHNIMSPFGTHFIFETDPTNLYDISYTINPEYAAYYAVNPSSYSDVNAGAGAGTTHYYFPVTITQAYNDLSVSLIPMWGAVPGFTYTNKIVYTNNGNMTMSGMLTFSKDPLVTIDATNPATTATATGFTYAFSGLLPGESRDIMITMTVPPIPAVELGQLLTNSVIITPITGDVVPENNEASVSQIVVGSYDPNDKMEAHGDRIVISDFTSSDYLYYTIRFENSGTASAYNVRIVDVLSSDLNPESLRMIDASHDYVLERVGNQLTWRFDNIMLPHSAANPEGAKGYVHFRIKPMPGYAAGDIITNTAAIFFDFNPAIITNTFSTQFVTSMGIGDAEISTFTVYPNPVRSILNISASANDTLQSVTLFDISGKMILSQNVEGSQASIDVSSISSGMYLAEVIGASGTKAVKKIIVE